MSNHVSNLRRTRADMIGTDDEEHYWECHEAADYIEELEAEVKELAKGNIERWERVCALANENEKLREMADAVKAHIATWPVENTDHPLYKAIAALEDNDE